MNERREGEKRMLKAERVKTCSQRASVWTSATRSTELREYCMYDEYVCVSSCVVARKLSGHSSSVEVRGCCLHLQCAQWPLPI